MVDMSDVSMEGVKAAGEPQGLPEGTYMVRIEDSERKPTKEKFYDDGRPHEDNGKNFYLQLLLKVYGGPNDGHAEYVRLNLWNGNETAVRIAKSELKAIQEVTGVFSSNSNDLHNKWLVLEVRPGIKDKAKLYNKYVAAPASLIDSFKHVPPVPPKPPEGYTAAQVAAAAPAQQAAPAAFTTQQAAPAPVQTQAAAAPATAPAAAAGGLPAWAQKK